MASSGIDPTTNQLGLLSGFASGIREALTGYQTIQNQKQAQQMQELTSGVQKDENGNLQLTPQAQQKKDFEAKKQQNEMNAYSRDEETNSPYALAFQKQHEALLRSGGLIGKEVPEGSYYQGQSPHQITENEAKTLSPMATIASARLKANSTTDAAETRADIAAAKAAAAANSPKGKDNPEKLYTDYTIKDNSFRGNKPAGDAASALRSVGNAQELINQYPDLNKMPQAQVNLLNDELAKIAGGGVATEGGRKELNSATYDSAYKAFLAKVGNNPTGAELGAFLQQNVKYLDGLKRANEDIVNGYHRQNYEAYRNRFPDNVNQRVQSLHPDWFDEHGNYSQKTNGPGLIGKGQPQPQTAGGLLSAQPASGAVQVNAQPSIKTGEVRQGFIFKGGDPADKNNWEKQ